MDDEAVEPKVNKSDDHMPENFDQLIEKYAGKEVVFLSRDPGKKQEISEPENQEEVEIRKPNRHERRRRAKLARMQEARDKAEGERRRGKK